MFTPDTDAASVRLPPPAVALASLVVGISLHLLWPVHLPLPSALRYLVGALMVASGAGLVATAMGLFKRSGQNPEPWKTTPALITTGVYARTRNPMYLSMGLVLAGIGLLANAALMVLMVPVMWGTIYVTAIAHEEAYLERKFGQAYLDYKQRVRRWI